jgi:nondiscriminating aspartyl-tRNA synthetase
MRTLAAEVEKHLSETVQLSGWVHRVRELGKISFVVLRDRSGMVQLVLEDQDLDLTTESVVQATGTVQENQKAPTGVEVRVEELHVIAAAQPDLPVPVNQDPEKLNLDALLDNRMISLRNPKTLAIFTLQAGLLQYFADYLRSEGFTEIKTSKLIATGTEGGTGLFAVDYFGDSVYLAQSPQFYKQAMIASGLERVFEIGTAYRAEKHETARHINEFVSLDVELAFIESDHDLMDLEEGILRYMIAQVAERNQKELEAWGASLPDLAHTAIPRISHDEAKKIVSQRLGRRVFELNPEAERALSDWALENHGVEAVFVNAWPRKKRPFYTFPDGLKTMSFDLIFRGQEITSGSRRISDYEMLLETLPKFGLTEEGMRDYAQIFRYGCPPHGGFAIGLERLTQAILALKNIKEACLFPRDRRRTRP